MEATTQDLLIEIGALHVQVNKLLAENARLRESLASVVRVESSDSEAAD